MILTKSFDFKLIPHLKGVLKIIVCGIGII